MSGSTTHDSVHDTAHDELTQTIITLNLHFPIFKMLCVPPWLPKQSEHAHPASQAAHQKKQALPLSWQTAHFPLLPFRTMWKNDTGKYPWPSWFFHLTLDPLFSFCYNKQWTGMSKQPNKNDTNCCKPNKLQQFFCTHF